MTLHQVYNLFHIKSYQPDRELSTDEDILGAVKTAIGTVEIFKDSRLLTIADRVRKLQTYKLFPETEKLVGLDEVLGIIGEYTEESEDDGI